MSGAPRGAPDGITPGFTRDTRLKMAAVGRGLLEVWELRDGAKARKIEAKLFSILLSL